MTTPTRGRPSQRQLRTVQRALHLVAGLALLAFVYLTPPPGSVATMLVRWVAVPMVVASGMLLWKWPRIRAALRRARTSP